MTVSGSGTGDEQTRVDREPPSFPSVGDPQGSSATTGSAPLFSSPATDNSGAETSPIVSQPLEPGTTGRGGRLRWLVAGAATLLVLLVVGGVLFLAAPRAGAASAVAHYAPADTAMYAELRLDLPGDQRDNLAAFMSHFPGFADQASFQQKLDESLNSVLISRTNGALDWNNDVKPWFDGQIGVFGTVSPPQLSAGATSGSDSQMLASPDVVVAFTVSDGTKLQSVIDSKAGSAQVSSTDYLGQQIKTIAQPAGMSRAASYVVTDDALLVSPSVDLLKQALDVKAGQKAALSDDTFFLQQLGALHADRLATVYYDAGKQMAAIPVASNSPLPAQCMQLSQVTGSAKYVGEVRAENDHLAFAIRSQVSTADGLPVPQNRQTTLAQAMPSDTMVYVEVRDAGAKVGSLIKNLVQCMSSAQSPGGPLPSGLGGIGDTSQLFETFLGAKPEDYLDFIDDVGVGVSYSNDTVGAGLVATVDDQAVATQRMDRLLELIKMLGSGFGGQSTGAQISTEELDHNGTKVTVIHVAPSDPGASPTSIQVAVANGRLYLGLNDFVTAALDRSASDSLASSGRYQKAVSAGPADNAGIVYVDVAGAADAYAADIPVDKKQDFDTNTKPFIDPLSSFSIVSRVDGGMMVRNGFLFVE